MGKSKDVLRGKMREKMNMCCEGRSGMLIQRRDTR